MKIEQNKAKYTNTKDNQRNKHNKLRQKNIYKENIIKQNMILLVEIRQNKIF